MSYDIRHVRVETNVLNVTKQGVHDLRVKVLLNLCSLYESGGLWVWQGILCVRGRELLCFFWGGTYSFIPYLLLNMFVCTALSTFLFNLSGRPQPRLEWFIDSVVVDSSYDQPEPGLTTNKLEVLQVDRTLKDGKLLCRATMPQMAPQEVVAHLLLNRKPICII